MKKLLRLFSGLAAAVVFTGCSLSSGKNPPESYDSEGATFQVEPITATVDTSKVDPVFQTPSERLINFKACVRESLFQKRLTNQSFAIDRAGSTVTHVTADDDGCLYWQESVPFNYFAPSRYLRESRVIRGNGAYPGQVTVPLAINLWLFGENLSPVVDLSKQKVGILNSEIIGFDTKDTQPLWIEQFELQDITESALTEKQITYTARLKIPVAFLTQDMKSNWVTVPISGGRYDAQIILYAQSPHSLQVLERVTLTGLTAERGIITADMKFTPRQVPANGVYKFGLRLTPVNAPQGLASFQGSFDYGPIPNHVWSGSKAARMEAGVFALKGAYSLDFLELQTLDAPVQKTGYQVAVGRKFTCSYNTFLSETTTTRTVGYKMRICFERQDGQILGHNATIKVTKNQIDPDTGAHQVVERTTDKEGCIDVEDSLKHKYFVGEYRHLAYFTVENKELDLHESIPLQINPWDYSWTFCRDARFLEPKAKDQLFNPEKYTETKSKSEYFIDNTDVTEQEVDYELDESLDLKVIKTLRLGLYPKVRRPSSQTVGVNQVEPLRTGLYLLRYALIRNHYEDPSQALQFISGGETIAQVVAGRLVKDVKIKMRDLRLIDSRNRLVIELSTIKEDSVVEVGPDLFEPKPGLSFDDLIDDDSGLPTKTFEGALELDNSYTVTLFAFDIGRLGDMSQAAGIQSTTPWRAKNLGDVLKLRGKIERETHRITHATRDEYLATQDLEVWTPQTPAFDQLSYESLTRIMNSKEVDSGLHNSLCRYFSMELLPKLVKEKYQVELYRGFVHDLRSNCLSSRRDFVNGLFEQYLGIPVRPFLIYQTILQVTSASYGGLEPPGRNYSISVGNDFSVGSDTSTSISAGIDIPLVAKIASGSVGYSIGTSTSNSLSYGLGISLNVEENTLRLNIDAHRKCLIVRMNPAAFDDHQTNFILTGRLPKEVREDAKQELIEKGITVCAETSYEPIVKLEKYFYVQAPKASGHQQDPTDLRNRPYAISLRSQRDFITFIRTGKITFDSPTPTGADYSGLNGFLGALDDSFEAVAPAAPGLYVDAVFY